MKKNRPFLVRRKSVVGEKDSNILLVETPVCSANPGLNEEHAGIARVETRD